MEVPMIRWFWIYLKSPAEDRKDPIIPIIYQPAVDGLKNFLREIHCSRKILMMQVPKWRFTLIFNNEQLRNHSRLKLCLRADTLCPLQQVHDVETF